MGSPQSSGQRHLAENQALKLWVSPPTPLELSQTKPIVSSRDMIQQTLSLSKELQQTSWRSLPKCNHLVNFYLNYFRSRNLFLICGSLNGHMIIRPSLGCLYLTPNPYTFSIAFFRLFLIAPQIHGARHFMIYYLWPQWTQDTSFPKLFSSTIKLSQLFPDIIIIIILCSIDSGNVDARPTPLCGSNKPAFLGSDKAL